ncbi:class I SAM-dependent methyltransferase [Allokutzneria sp. NRRL B-24872]|uniref:class I SAM-dependent methyltransferase n=1 Tax=Allokutzneria sp. NRRL B-24872 TaxID=1137961 RepID=UPI000A38838D|nr:class I SAM-dependent methyltransferase [Allokutzneria sp. NRRL B-24872]
MPDHSTVVDDAVENDYDTFGEAYSKENEQSLINNYYTRPAIANLAGDVAGRRVLDAGCGSGPIMASLRERGAEVSGFDFSATMVRLARERLGEDVDLRVADLTEPLPYADGEFDDVVSALVLHYFEDWDAPLAELRRVLKPGGRLILAVNHPSVYKFIRPDGNYFEVEKWADDYVFAGQKAVLTYWHRPLHAMTDAITAAGFRISVISEPHPAPEAYDLFPDDFQDRKAFLCFLFFVLEAV